MGTAEMQGELWGWAPEDWAELQEPTGAPIYEATFDAMGVSDGCQLLDVGCGSGFALQVAHKRGAGVSGFDASEAMLRVARARLPEADFRQGELEALPYDGDSFDAVTAFNSVQYASDPVQGLREIKRVAVPGAPVAVATWGVTPSGATARCSSARSVRSCLRPRRAPAAPSRSLPPGRSKAGRAGRAHRRSRARGLDTVRVPRHRHGGAGEPVRGAEPPGCQPRRARRGPRRVHHGARAVRRARRLGATGQRVPVVIAHA